MNPRVGLTVVTSSFIIRLTMVVLPALSRPLGSLASRPEQPAKVHTASIYAFLYLLNGLFEESTTWLRKFPAWCFFGGEMQRGKCCQVPDGDIRFLSVTRTWLSFQIRPSERHIIICSAIILIAGISQWHCIGLEVIASISCNVEGSKSRL